jgi:hypothetical protein
MMMENVLKNMVMFDRITEKEEARRGSTTCFHPNAKRMFVAALASSWAVHQDDSLVEALTSPYRLKAQSPSVTTDDGTLSSVQWRKKNRANDWDMQTKVTTFRRGGGSDQTVVELHAQLHYGDTEYYNFWNSDEFNHKFDKVLFELLLDDSLLEYDQQRGDWTVKESIMASPNDQAVAAQYGWQCQADSIKYTQKKWAHADLTRQEFVKLVQNGDADKVSTNQPLWKLAASSSLSSGAQSSSTAAEAVAALMVGPPTLLTYSKHLKRRLFTNLFLPGDSLALSLRSILWWTVPCPELSVILLDWSSLLQGQKQRGGQRSPASTRSSVPFSEMALPILTSLVQLNIPQMRRFLFGQVLLSGSSAATANEDEAWSVLVTQRNDHALKVLQATLDQPDTNSVALLYGSSHCPDLHRKLLSMGFRPTKSEWRTVWSVQQGGNELEEGSDKSSGPNILPALAAVLVFYLGIGALDWVGMLGDVSQSLFEKHDYADAGLEAGLYLLRHVLLYLGFSKFLVDWTNSNPVTAPDSGSDDNAS